MAAGGPSGGNVAAAGPSGCNVVPRSNACNVTTSCVGSSSNSYVPSSGFVPVSIPPMNTPPPPYGVVNPFMVSTPRSPDSSDEFNGRGSYTQL